MPLNYWLLLHACLAGLCAWCFAAVLNQPGMLLYRPYRWCYDALERKYVNVEENAPMWWKPLWGCTSCVSVWWGLATYLVHGGRRLDELLYAGALALLTSKLLTRYA